MIIRCHETFVWCQIDTKFCEISYFIFHMDGFDSKTACKFHLESRILKLRPRALPNPSTNLSSTLLSICCPYLAYVSSSFQCTHHMVCWMMHHTPQSYQGTHQGTIWNLEGHRFTYHNVKVTTYSLHSMIMINRTIIVVCKSSSEVASSFAITINNQQLYSRKYTRDQIG